ncbi:lytic transglycosylase domain-containing protein [Amycolatopsis thermoflava]|uniref:lytic transglycosylase domain-containing protein n=1 Tax=Amycolatopsis thermoflava TaxID=84480 RepID=UPI00041CDBD4|nr:lytic transglycosylase domain-containing protein [Amycolatopsis thermoflava]
MKHVTRAAGLLGAGLALVGVTALPVDGSGAGTAVPQALSLGEPPRIDDLGRPYEVVAQPPRLPVPPTLPPPTSLPAPGPRVRASPVSLGVGVPAAALAAYHRAADAVAGCGLSWTVLAAIGRVESNHGRHGGSQVYEDGSVVPRIRGLALDGAGGTASIPDTDRGALDGDPVLDRAVGPMQFIPSTWRAYAADGNGDRRADPDNIFDAALAAGRYLCAGGGNLADPGQLRAAVFRYNHSDAYVDLVLALADAYARGAVAAIAVPAVAPAPPPVTTPPPPPQVTEVPAPSTTAPATSTTPSMSTTPSTGTSSPATSSSSTTSSTPSPSSSRPSSSSAPSKTRSSTATTTTTG